ncbi:outer membrane biogenesis lipoprotein LolB [Hymenobacter sp. UYAg731]
MKTFLLRATALLLLTAATAQAQVPRRYPVAISTPSTSQPHDYPLTPAPRYATGGHPGTYRLPDGSWHPA